MKIQYIYKLVAAAILSLLLIVGCKGNDYLIDGGKSKAEFDGTVMQYLESRPDYFADLVEIIRYAEMESVFNDETITFFAPPDPSIESSVNILSDYLYRYMGQDKITDYKQIDPSVWREMLSMYIIKDKYLLKDIPQIDTTMLDAYGGQAFITYGERPMNVGVVYHDSNNIKYAGYRQLIISLVTDFISKNMLNAYVASSDIQPKNGAVHVLRFDSHGFGFDRTDFMIKAIAAGIKPAQKPQKNTGYEDKK